MERAHASLGDVVFSIFSSTARISGALDLLELSISSSTARISGGTLSIVNLPVAGSSLTPPSCRASLGGGWEFLAPEDAPLDLVEQASLAAYAFELTLLQR